MSKVDEFYNSNISNVDEYLKKNNIENLVTSIENIRDLKIKIDNLDTVDEFRRTIHKYAKTILDQKIDEAVLKEKKRLEKFSKRVKRGRNTTIELTENDTIDSIVKKCIDKEL